MATKDVKEFNGWFNRSYARLKERLSIYGKIDEDAFHDAYLAVRKQVMFASGGIDELESAPETSISQDWVRRTARKRQRNGKRC